MSAVERVQVAHALKTWRRAVLQPPRQGQPQQRSRPSTGWVQQRGGGGAYYDYDSAGTGAPAAHHHDPVAEGRHGNGMANYDESSPAFSIRSVGDLGI